MTNNILTELKDRLGADKMLTGPDVKDRYHHIWKTFEPLQAKAVLFPKSTADVSTILSICNAFDQPVVIHGGLTNLVGGTETNEKEVVISMEKMNQIEEIDDKSRTISVQAGVILEQVQNAAKEQNLLFPLNFGAKGSAQIGGIISNNAGGLRVFRYGMTRSLVLGLEVVLADGTLISSMKKIIKDNSGYDLKQLFIGAEGTLGVVTRAILKLVEAPKSRNSAFIGFDDYDKVVDFLKFIDSGLAGTLSGFELIWKNTFRALTSFPAVVKAPLPYDYKYYVLIESLGSHPENDKNAMQTLLQKALEAELILDAVMAHTQSDLDWFWKVREEVGVLASAANHDQHFDISLPIPLIGDLLDDIHETLSKVPKVSEIFIFGHIADGNIHLIIGKAEQNEEIIKTINDIIYLPLKSIGGSVSAEHGIGLHKKSYLHLCRTNEEIQLMQTLKNNLDPKGILNRGKLI